MIGTSRYKGAIIFDSIMSMVPIVMIFLVFFQYIAILLPSEDGKISKLISVSEYTVKTGAAYRENGIRYPNWVDTGKISEGYVNDISSRMGLENLKISTVPGDGTCIYRIVTLGPDRVVSKLFFCG